MKTFINMLRGIFWVMLLFVSTYATCVFGLEWVKRTSVRDEPGPASISVRLVQDEGVKVSFLKK